MAIINCNSNQCKWCTNGECTLQGIKVINGLCQELVKEQSV
ncbi:MAG: hypothetical protein E6590_16685 [Clostridiales bacterium]|jgi:hypothetical protein|nr:hypothetical protein [Zhenhengia yiwuensis]MDU6361569.1 hypothetical protein [Clostridiales bacterium]